MRDQDELNIAFWYSLNYDSLELCTLADCKHYNSIECLLPPNIEVLKLSLDTHTLRINFPCRWFCFSLRT
jgi:hypothetical protein